MLSFASLPLIGLMAWSAAAAAPTAVSSSGAQRAIPASQVPDAENLSTWADFIRPDGEELKFESIGWRNQFWPAVQEAKELGRPILLWTMNGHPLGCT